jgi:hypothetical protein
MSPVVRNVRMRGVAAVATVALLAAACGGDEPTSPPAAERSTTSVKAPTTVASTTTTTDVTALDTSGEDFDRVFRNIMAIRDAAYATPRTDLLERIYSHECKCYPINLRQVQDYVDRGVRHVAGFPEVLKVEVVARPSPTVVELRVVDREDTQFVEDRNGNRVREGDGWARTSKIYTLQLSDRGWVIQRLVSEGLAEEFT